MNTWRSIIMQFGTPIVLLVCLIVAMHQRDQTFTAAVEAQKLAVQFKRVAMDSTLQTSDAIDALRICQSNFSAYLATHQAPAWPLDLPPSGVSLTNSHDLFTYGVPAGKPAMDNGTNIFGILRPVPFSSVSNVTCIGNGAGLNLTNSNVVLVGKDAQADKDWQLVIRFQDGTELRQDLPHVTIDMGWGQEMQSSFEWEKP